MRHIISGILSVYAAVFMIAGDALAACEACGPQDAERVCLYHATASDTAQSGGYLLIREHAAFTHLRVHPDDEIVDIELCKKRGMTNATNENSYTQGNAGVTVDEAGEILGSFTDQ